MPATILEAATEFAAILSALTAPVYVFCSTVTASEAISVAVIAPASIFAEVMALAFILLML